MNLFTRIQDLFGDRPLPLQPFCTRCGSPMHWRRWQSGYNANTGRPEFCETWECSKPDKKQEGWTAYPHDIYGFGFRRVTGD